jgi:hypothetical protein
MSRKITNYFTSSQQAKKCKVNDNSVKTEDATTVLCDTASAVDHVECGHTALSSDDHGRVSTRPHLLRIFLNVGILIRKMNFAIDMTG